MKDKRAELTYKEVIDAVVALQDPAVTSTLEDLTVKEKIRVNRVFRALGDAYSEYETKRVEIVEEFGERDEEGSVIQVLNEDGQPGGAKIANQEGFDAAITALWKESPEVEVPVAQYGGLLNTKLSFRFLRAFEKIFVE